MALTEARHAGYLNLMKMLGLRTAQFHLALARPETGGDSASNFSGEAISAEDVLEWVGAAKTAMQNLFERMQLEMPQWPSELQSAVRALIAARAKLYRRIVRLAHVRLDGQKARGHGHYHLGQVWLANNDVLIANYASEPGRTWAERRRKQPPLLDVASLLLSIESVGDDALHRLADVSNPPDALTPLRRQVDVWAQLARRALLRSYRKAMLGHAVYPTDSRAADAMLTFFLAEKAITEVNAALDQPGAEAIDAIRRLLRVAQH
jgi:maltose alpha-D-glucosyltransferase / alpha-amylase